MSRLLPHLKRNKHPSFLRLPQSLLSLRLRQLPSSRTYAATTPFDHPSPPKLPADQQAEFERLQREAAVTAAFTPTPASGASTSSESQSEAAAPASAAAAAGETKSQETPLSRDEKDPNQGIFRGAPPEFQGDVNPKTGEVGGPKNEPLRWGGQGEWSYNGRATDF